MLATLPSGGVRVSRGRWHRIWGGSGESRAGICRRRRFVVCLQNHDQIGNRAMGERLTVVGEPGGAEVRRWRCMLMAPFIPMLFMGEESASTSPFLFFTEP